MTTIPNLTRGCFKYTTSELRIMDTYTGINLYFSNGYINQFCFSMTSFQPGLGYWPQEDSSLLSVYLCVPFRVHFFQSCVSLCDTLVLLPLSRLSRCSVLLSGLRLKRVLRIFLSWDGGGSKDWRSEVLTIRYLKTTNSEGQTHQTLPSGSFTYVYGKTFWVPCYFCHVVSSVLRTQS